MINMKKTKKLLVIALALVLALSQVIIADAFNIDESLDFPNFIKVGLYYGSNAPTSLTLSCNDGFEIFELSGGQFIYLDSISSSSIDISTNSGYLSEGKQILYMSANSDIDSRLVKVTVNGTTKTYRDGYLLYQNGGAIRVMNYVTLEHYAWGSVNCEMSYDHDIAALQAQAIAIRTYAMKEHHSGFNVCTGTDCLVYGGYAREHQKTTQACIDTEGLIMTYDDEPIDAYFSAASGGGYTMSLYDAWGKDDVPYLQSAVDPYTPEYTWRTTYTFPEIRQRIINYYNEDLGEITYFEISKTTSFGAATQIYVKGTKGIKVIPRSQIMNVFNLKSTFFSIGSDGYHDLTTGNTETNNATPTTSINLDSTVYVLSASGLKQVSSSDIYIFNGTTTTKYQANKNATYIVNNDICTDGYVYMNGLGFGHGIGMSQTGAYAMAKVGYSYKDILLQYYKGIDIVEAKDVF